MLLQRSGTTVSTIFNLLGQKEDDMIFSLGHVASRSERFTGLLVAHIAGTSVGPCKDAVISLQTATADGGGRTDVEIKIPGIFVTVIEAKRGSTLPGRAQLQKYVPVLRAVGTPLQYLVAMTNTPTDVAGLLLPANLDGVPVRHITWRETRKISLRARDEESHHNKRLLDEFTDYLHGILGMEKIRSNMVYVMSWSRDGAWGLPFLDVVYKHGRYFYPIDGGGWPPPPNYVAFRYDGRLQSIHHVEGHTVITNPRTIFPEAEDKAVAAHYCLSLGPAMRPPKAVKSGPKILRNGRVWCMLDTLLTSDTITAAHAETKKRLGEQ